MKILGIDGALGSFSAAVTIDRRVVAERELGGHVALEAGLALISDVLSGSGLRGNELDRIAVGTGPGGFTGLRIAIAYAKSLAQAWVVPLVAVSSFDALEYGTDLAEALTVVVGRPGIISARYRNGTSTRRASGPIHEVLKEVLPAGGLPVIAINAAEDVLAACAEGGYIVESRSAAITPPAAAIALAAEDLRPAASSHEVRADYGELPAAKVPQFRAVREER